MPDLLTIERLSAGYGEAVVLNEVSLALAEGQSLALLGRNGMGKTTLINSIVGVTRFIGRDDRARRPRHHALAPRPAGARRHRLGAAGAQHLQVADGGGESHCRGASGPMDEGAHLRAVPAAERAPPQPRQPALWRRAADARGRSRLDPQSARHAARRAPGRAGADPGRRTAARRCGASSATRACPRSWWSRMRRRCSASPTGRRSSSAERWSTRARARISPPIGRCWRAISGSPPLGLAAAARPGIDWRALRDAVMGFVPHGRFRFEWAPVSGPKRACADARDRHALLRTARRPGQFAVVLWLTAPWLPCLCSR